MNSWFLLLLAGLCEVGWVLGLKYANGSFFTRYSIIIVTFMFFSMYFLAIAVRNIPIGIAYSVWVGIGAAGAYLGGILVFHEKVNLLEIFFVSLIVVGIIGQKLSVSDAT